MARKKPSEPIDIGTRQRKPKVEHDGSDDHTGRIIDLGQQAEFDRFWTMFIGRAANKLPRILAEHGESA
jgi:hypothetical protein